MQTQEKQDMDERSIIREQDRLAKEKKKEKNRMEKRVLVIILVVILAALFWYLGWGRKLSVQEQTTQVNIETTGNQKVTYATIQSIRGNEITYVLTEGDGEEVTEMIPVGTDVTTKLGTVATFSRICAGDSVAIVKEPVGDSDVIVAVYIVG